MALPYNGIFYEKNSSTSTTAGIRLIIEMSKTPIKCKPQTKQKNRNEVVSKKENTKTNLAAKTTKPSKKYSKKIKRNVLRILNSEQKLRT